MSNLHIDAKCNHNKSNIKLTVENTPEKPDSRLAFLLEAINIVSHVSISLPPL